MNKLFCIMTMAIVLFMWGVAGAGNIWIEHEPEWLNDYGPSIEFAVNSLDALRAKAKEINSDGEKAPRIITVLHPKLDEAKMDDLMWEELGYKDGGIGSKGELELNMYIPGSVWLYQSQVRTISPDGLPYQSPPWTMVEHPYDLKIRQAQEEFREWQDSQCYWQLHFEPFETAEQWSKDNPGWEPFAADHRYGGWVIFRKKVCP